MKKIILSLFILTISQQANCSSQQNYTRQMEQFAQTKRAFIQTLPKGVTHLTTQQKEFIQREIIWNGGYLYPKNHPNVQHLYTELRQLQNNTTTNATNSSPLTDRQLQRRITELSNAIHSVSITTQQLLDFYHTDECPIK